MKKVYSIFLFLISSSLFSQEFTPNQINQVIVRESSGDIQTRFVNSALWTPVLSGMSVPVSSFIRLNSLNSTITVSFPDGSLLKLIGIGSIYIDQISKSIFNSYQNKLLLISGRWAYKSTTNNKNRLIVNTDVTTSIIENGMGSGYFYEGTNEFVVIKGRGVISYKQAGARAMVIDEKQYVNFNIFEGFFAPKLATDKILAQYFFFEDETSAKATSNNSKTNSNNDNNFRLSSAIDFELPTLEYQAPQYKAQNYNENQNLFSSFEDTSKTAIQVQDISMNYLDSLTSLQFPIKTRQVVSTVIKKKVKTQQDASEVVKTQTKKAPSVNQNVNSELLKTFSADNFKIKKAKPKATTKTTNAPKTTTIDTAQRKRNVVKDKNATRRNKKNNNQQAETKSAEVNIDDLVASLDEQASAEQSKKRKKTSAPVDVIAPDEPLINIIKEEPKPPSNVKLNTVPDVKAEEAARKRAKARAAARAKARQAAQAARAAEEAALAAEEEEARAAEEARRLGHDAPDSFWNRDLNSDQYKLGDGFNPQNDDDFINSEFNSVLFNY